MSIMDVFRVGKIKTELQQIQQERDDLRQFLAETERFTLHEIRQAIAQAEDRRAQVERDIEARKATADQEMQTVEADFAQRRETLTQQIAELDQQIAARKQEVIVLDDELLLQSFGFYQPRYQLQNSDQYKARLDQIRARQAALVKAGKAAVCAIAWTVNNSKREGERMIRDYTKLILRSFNNECDASMINVKFSNVESIEKKIRKAFEMLNKLAARHQVTITDEYLKLKLEELYLCHEYQVMKQQEKEEQKRLRQEAREEAKLLREIEAAKQKIAKEETHFNKALQSIAERLQRAESDAERATLEQEMTKIENRLAEIEKNKQDIQNREQNTRAGYVYVISNVGSFGENIYKIGVTRRLDPQERVNELGDASVPFNFDIHATIFSEDAPGLENALHKAFADRRVNLINNRREFFKVSLEEIEQVVKASFHKPVEFTRLADAAEYRQSLMLRQASLVRG